MKTGFKFYPEKWLGNRALRTCSPAARGFWMDLLALMYPSGYLTMPDGSPMSDQQLSQLVGIPVRQVRAWINELGVAKIFTVLADGKMCSDRMVKEAAFVAQAKAAGERGQLIKKARARPIAALAAGAAVAPGTVLEVPHGMVRIYRTHTTETHGAPPAPDAEAPAPPPPPAKKSLPWWQSKAGWIRKGNEQAMSMKPGEEFPEFQIRVAARLPMGRHLDVLTPGQVRAVDAAIPKGPGDKEKAAGY